MIRSEDLKEHDHYLTNFKKASEKGHSQLRLFIKRSSHPNLAFLAKLAFFTLTQPQLFTPEELEEIHHKKFAKHRGVFRKNFYSATHLERIVHRPYKLQKVLLSICLYLPLLTAQVALKNGSNDVAKRAKTSQ